jgi:hypothetical protein
VVTRSSLRVFRLPSRAAIERLSDKFQALCRGREAPQPGAGSKDWRHSQAEHNDAIRQAAAAFGRQ